MSRVQFGHYQGPGGAVTARNYSAGSLGIVQNQLTPQVVAQRVLGNWTFYYQIWNTIAFTITEKDRWGQITYNTRNRTVNVNVVLAWGQLWPNDTVSTVVF